MSWIRHETKKKDDVLIYSSQSLVSSSSSFSSSSSPSSPYSAPLASSGNKVSPAILYIIVVLAVILFISGVLHLLVRFLLKHRSSSSVSESNRYPDMSSGSDAFQRQLQQLFHLHDSGLDQAFIDALPVFYYKEIMGLKEPFDCAVCLCEFSVQDKLRLLPMCSHAFHIDCIDTWLLSNSTCPLCRGTLYMPGLSFENPVFDFEDSREEVCIPSTGEIRVAAPGPKLTDNSNNNNNNNEIVNSKRVFSVRLGKFRSTNNGGGREVEGEGEGEGEGERVEGIKGESSNSVNLDGRRCYSMGSYQYVVADSDLRVALVPTRNGSTTGGSGSMRSMKRRIITQDVNYSSVDGDGDGDGDAEGKKINMRSKGESFSVSKIWQWSKRGKFHNSAETHINMGSSTVRLPME